MTYNTIDAAPIAARSAAEKAKATAAMLEEPAAAFTDEKFDDCDITESRLKDRPADLRVVEEQESSAAESDTKWGGRPSVKDQLLRFPESVVTDAPITCVFQLADQKSLAKLNKLQSKAYGDSPSVAIADYERQFHNGAWSVILTYSEIKYQQI